MTASTPLWVTFLFAVVSGLIGILISTWLYLRYEKRKLKIEAFRRILGSRHGAISGSSVVSQEAFFSSLNEVLAVFHDCPNVLNALRTFHAELGQSAHFADNLVGLFRSICDELGISRKVVPDSFFLRPFIPGPVLHNPQPQPGAPGDAPPEGLP